RSLQLPTGKMLPIGYVILQHAVRLDRPVKAYERWMQRIPDIYQAEVAGEKTLFTTRRQKDPNCLAMLKNYRGLMPLAQDALKPIFHLKPGDGALGGHMAAVQDCHKDFEKLARAIADKYGICLP